jgi:phosphoglycolate phosphatase
MGYNFKYWLFDLDGTITDSSAGIINSYKRVERKMGLTESADEIVKQYIGPSIHEYFEVVHKLNNEKLGKAITHYREYYALKGLYENMVYEGIKELLDVLKEKHKIMYLVTGKPEIYAKEVLRYFRLENYFQGVYGSALAMTNSPKEELIERFLQNENVQPELCIMIGDRKHDVNGAKYHKMSSAAVTYGYGSLEELKSALPEFLINSPGELLRLTE